VTCRELAGFIGDYLAGELGASERALFERHLQLCPNCRRYLAGYEASVRLGRHAFDDDDAEAPGDVPAELVDAILAARRHAGK
jgi:anti-sigma factor RsiW